MTAEPEQSARQPQPFAEAPIEPPRGCGRPLLIGCALVAVLLGLFLLGVVWQAEELIPALFRWSLEQVERQIEAALPADLDTAERQRLAEAFDAAATAVEDGTAEVSDLRRLQDKLLEVLRNKSLTREQVLDLIEALETVAGGRDPSPSEESVPVPEPLPQASVPFAT